MCAGAQSIQYPLASDYSDHSILGANIQVAKVGTPSQSTERAASFGTLHWVFRDIDSMKQRMTAMINSLIVSCVPQVTIEGMNPLEELLNAGV